MRRRAAPRRAGTGPRASISPSRSASRSCFTSQRSCVPPAWSLRRTEVQARTTGNEDVEEGEGLGALHDSRHEPRPMMMSPGARRARRAGPVRGAGRPRPRADLDLRAVARHDRPEGLRRGRPRPSSGGRRRTSSGRRHGRRGRRRRRQQTPRGGREVAGDLREEAHPVPRHAARDPPGPPPPTELGLGGGARDAPGPPKGLRVVVPEAEGAPHPFAGREQASPRPPSAGTRPRWRSWRHYRPGRSYGALGGRALNRVLFNNTRFHAWPRHCPPGPGVAIVVESVA